MGPSSSRLISTFLTLIWFLTTGVDLAGASQSQQPQVPYKRPPYTQKKQKPAVLPPTNTPPAKQLPQGKELPPSKLNQQKPASDLPPQVPKKPGQDPGASPGPGGGGSPDAGKQQLPASKLTVSTGVLTVEPVTGLLKLAVDSKKLTGLAAQAREAKQDRVILSIVNPGGAPVNQYQAQIPLTALKDVSAAQRKLVIATESGSVVIPPAVLTELPKAASGGELQVTIQPASGKDRQNISQAAGESLAISFLVKGTNGQNKAIEAFASPVTLSLKYDSQLPQNKLSRLGIYRLNEQTGNWAYVGGKVNTVEGTVDVQRKSFSTYSVRLYEQGYIDLVGHWARTEVEFLANQGLIKGLSDLTYGPEQKITRAEFATLLQRALKLPQAKAARFKDIKHQDWFAGGVGAVAQAGLVTGSPDGTFNPQSSITRQEMAVMLARALTKEKQLKLSGDPLTAFADRSKVAPWAKEQLAIAVQSGLIKGQTANRFAPGAGATRAEAAVMLKRLMTSLNKIN